MNRFEKVIQILDASVGGPTAPVGFHHAFWRGVTRNQFVAKKIFGLQLISVGNGPQSTLIKALKGELPFGADVPGLPDAEFNRMPSGRDPVPPVDIAFIEKWIDDGCLEDDVVAVAPLKWRKTSAPVASSRTDDIWFNDPLSGWAVNSDGNIIKTSDGGDTWTVQHSAPGVYLRCVGFANSNVGWVGTLTRNRRLFHTTNGGSTWSAVTSLPALAPVAICGISVVSDQIVYASGTNRPSDFPRMMKTIDGGATWTAWEMSAHASILIDTYFKDSMHGWVVGGKSTEPTPTERELVKPVVLETTDGGATWTNRLAGQEADFPLGEWGWKIQFLTDQIGFVSLENFEDGAILKTIDGGQSWTRLKINDAQANKNLEGIGFIDEHRGWVGGWGSSDFTRGSTSATVDGGNNWTDANEVGKFLNRFRFFGNPVTVGYASGDTVYKYSSAPVPVASVGAIRMVATERALLPQTTFACADEVIPVRINAPANAKRLTLQVWDRFGVEVGYVLDEIDPPAGERVFRWDACDSLGKAIPAGHYILRLTIDDKSASSILHRQAPATPRGAVASRIVKSRMPFGSESVPRARTLQQLMQDTKAPDRDLQWLKDSLQIALQLELATLPPYLTAFWTIKDSFDPVAESITEIWREEMGHFGLACNLLTAIGGTPKVADATVVPTYPGSLPGGVRPSLTVTLRRLDVAQAAVFMDIEYPAGGPVAFAETVTYDSIGEFYSAILAAFNLVQPPLSLDRQLNSSSVGVFKIGVMADVERAINLINLQGEGSNKTPEEAPGDLAHFYRFGEIHHQKRFVKNDVTGGWGYDGDPVTLPDIWDMADIPPGGYKQVDVPDLAIWDLILRFDQEYSEMLRLLEQAWLHGQGSTLGQAIGWMRQMGDTARELLTKARTDGKSYGPCFRYVP